MKFVAYADPVEQGILFLNLLRFTGVEPSKREDSSLLTYTVLQWDPTGFENGKKIVPVNFESMSSIYHASDLDKGNPTLSLHRMSLDQVYPGDASTGKCYATQPVEALAIEADDIRSLRLFPTVRTENGKPLMMLELKGQRSPLTVTGDFSPLLLCTGITGSVFSALLADTSTAPDVRGNASPKGKGSLPAPSPQ